ncbi:MAG TPA: hypothetical protein PK096_00170 [Candidatus Saccharibacteria bacterium]|nr:hypothetical protein [Candidatus Saccharibacteria bacterium]HRK93770.1 hypothetical protein [Candidatus Saccharibacteria bacterium]
MAHLKLIHHRHSGRLRPHEHTSYLPLAVLLAAVGFMLTVYTSYAASPGPESSSIGLTGVVEGKPPTAAPTIDKPKSGQRFSTTPVSVSGSCPKDTLVEVFKNNIFAGSVPCQDDGSYSLDIDLLIGKNVLVARVYDDLNQAGPDSNKPTVFYDALAPQSGPLTSLDFGGAQLLLNTDAVFRGVFPNQELSMPIDILGGTPPYAVNIQWGDSSNKVVPRKNNLGFTVGHVYSNPGTYQVSIQGSDANGRVAFLTVAAIVNGQPTVTTSDKDGAAVSNSVLTRLLTLWPLYTSVVAIAVSFWLGERREKRLLLRAGPVYHS